MICLKIKSGELAVFLGIALFLVVVQLLSLLLVQPLNSYDLRAFDNPQSVWNPIYYIILILVFTAVLLIIIKYKINWLIQAFVAVAVLSTLVYVLFGLIVMLVPSVDGLVAAAISFAGSLVLTALLIVYPEWYVIDTVGVLVAAGASALFGVSLAVIPSLVLLILLAVYDFISVYKTKHMVRLAEGVMDLKLPIMFVLPRRWGYSYAKAKRVETGEEREAYFMGLGDAVMPTILTVSANAFIRAPMIGFINVPALGSMIGTLVSYALLMYLVIKVKKPQAGLPFLCTGSIIGFLLGCAAVGINPFF